jgi:hypothetical protein
MKMSQEHEMRSWLILRVLTVSQFYNQCAMALRLHLGLAQPCFKVLGANTGIRSGSQQLIVQHCPKVAGWQVPSHEQSYSTIRFL